VNTWAGGLRAAEPRPGGRLLGIGAAQPDSVTTSADLGAPFGKDADWIRQRTGIHSVRRMDPADELTGLGDRAATQALAAADVTEADVDLVLTVSCSETNPHRLLSPHLVAQAARAQINAACSGFCYALGAADSHIRAGHAEHVLIVAAERMSGLLDHTDLGTSIIFGDGAGAAVVGPAPPGPPAIGPTVSGSDGAQPNLIHCDPGANGTLRMAGRDVFRWAIENTPTLAREACRRAGVEVSDIEVFIPHQANLRIIDALTGSLGLEHAVVATAITASGNTSGASIPIALARLAERRLVQTGQLALMVGFGAGLSYAAQVVVLP